MRLGGFGSLGNVLGAKKRGSVGGYSGGGDNDDEFGDGGDDGYGSEGSWREDGSGSGDDGSSEVASTVHTFATGEGLDTFSPLRGGGGFAAMGGGGGGGAHKQWAGARGGGARGLSSGHGGGHQPGSSQGQRGGAGGLGSPSPAKGPAKATAGKELHVYRSAGCTRHHHGLGWAVRKFVTESVLPLVGTKNIEGMVFKAMHSEEMLLLLERCVHAREAQRARTGTNTQAWFLPLSSSLHPIFLSLFLPLFLSPPHTQLFLTVL